MAPKVYSGFQQFDEVDATGKQAAYIEYLQRMEQLPEVVDRRRRSYELLALQPGDRVADVGCGLGTATRELAALGFRALGVDKSEAMIAEARRRSGAEPIEFRCADADALPFEDGSLAGYRAERLYQHLSDPGTALAEARRVLTPGGCLVVDDPDWDALLFDGEPKDVTRTILRAFSDSIVNGWIGRSFRRLLTSAGFVEVTVHPDTSIITDPQRGRGLARAAANAAIEAGAVDPAIANRWLEDQWARCDADAFFASLTSFLAVARRPH